MATYNLPGGNTYNRSSYILGSWVQTDITVPNGRATANGLTPVLITGVHVWWGARNGTFDGTVSIGPRSSSHATISGGGWPQVAIPMWGAFTAGGNTTLRLNNWTGNGFNFGRVSGAGSGITSDSGGWSNSTIGGFFTYAIAPLAPSTPAITVHGGGKCTVTFNASSDNGGTGYTGYVLQYATRSDFHSAVTVGSSGTSNLDLTPGKLYYFRAASRNGVTDAYGTTSPWSGASSARMLSGGKVRVGGSWVPGIVKVRQGGTWHNGLVKVRQGGAWKDAL